MGKDYGYARAATVVGKPPYQQIQSQVERLKAAGCTEIFIDAPQSGSSRGLDLQRALKTLGKGDRLTICDWSRFSRNEPMTIYSEFQERGIEVVVLDGPKLDSNYVSVRSVAERIELTMPDVAVADED